MNIKGFYIPGATIEKLIHPPEPGSRHKTMISIALSLIGNGFHPDAVQVQFRRMFPDSGPDAVPDKEIQAIVDGAVAYQPQPSIPHAGQGAVEARVQPRIAAKVNPDEAQRRVEQFLGGFEWSMADLRQRSPARFPDDPALQASCFLRKVYGEADLINIVWQHKVFESLGKAVPWGCGTVLPRTAWCDKIDEQRFAPQGPAGCWVRLNPLDGAGIADKNVAVFRYALLEFDRLPFDLQIAFFARLKLPIAALVTSGGRSIHAWVRVAAADKDEYARVVRRMLNSLAPFGVDQANKNPSRLARLPGAQRTIGAVGDGLQTLLFLNPTPAPDQVIADLPPTH